MSLIRFINKPQTMIIFNELFANNPNSITQIGRWIVPTTPKYIEKSTLIMDRSNEDHCGPCGQYALKKIKHANPK